MAGVSGVGIHDLAKRAGLDPAIINRLVQEMHDAVAGGERVKLRGFGSFEARDLAVDSTRTPPVKFSPSQSLKDAISEQEEGWHEDRNGSVFDSDEEE